MVLGVHGYDKPVMGLANICFPRGPRFRTGVDNILNNFSAKTIFSGSKTNWDVGFHHGNAPFSMILSCGERQ